MAFGQLAGSFLSLAEAGWFGPFWNEADRLYFYNRLLWFSADGSFAVTYGCRSVCFVSKLSAIS